MKITVTNGIGRQQNPYDADIKVDFMPDVYEPNPKWFEFQKLVKSYPAPGIPDTAEGEFVEAELVWQEKFAGMWHNLKSINERSPVGMWRQAYVLSTPPVKEVERSGVKTPYELIIDERVRKAEKYGWDTQAIIERTEDYGHGELSAAAACYCLPVLANEYFPWDLSYFKPTKDMPTREQRIIELVKAGAFIVDEIIRIQQLHQLNNPLT